ncbi:MAG: fumarylacetoacetate hydrolase family protein [Alphaproteobacteria bacterium]|nr:fumarylacetoacetate hydrolase family protein [Alphaproteobacteria bacterium]
MRLCRYDDDRLGLVKGDQVLDVSEALGVIPATRWPAPTGDALITHLDAVRAEVAKLEGSAKATPIADVTLKSPVANPTKVIGAPVNYAKHVAEAQADPNIAPGQKILGIEDYGPFLKANSSLVGPGEGVALRFTDRRNDHEGELGVVISRTGVDIPLDAAGDYIAGYALALDMTVRGNEDRSVRKSLDSYSVLGPWLVTKDEVGDANALDLKLWVDDELRQDSNTSFLIYNVEKLISWCSTFYTLHPGDIIMTGTPEGVGPVKAGNMITLEIEKVGRMEVPVRNA